MCGICGEITLSGGEAPLVSTVQAMNRAMRHRGPDGQGEYADEHVAIGSTRLAIIDLAGGQQPIHNEDQTIWIVFNGEIYNFAGPAAASSSGSGTPSTHNPTPRSSSTPTRSTATSASATSTASSPSRSGTPGPAALFIARDRIGVKPLFYTQTSRSLIFASELNVLLTHPLVDRKIDLVSLDQYLTFEYVPTPRSIIKGVKKLPPGHTLTVRDGRVDVEPVLGRPPGAQRDRPPPDRRVRARPDRPAPGRREQGAVERRGGRGAALGRHRLQRARRGRRPRLLADDSRRSPPPSRMARSTSRGTRARVARARRQRPPRGRHLHGRDAGRGADAWARLVDEPLGDSSFVPTYLL